MLVYNYDLEEIICYTKFHNKYRRLVSSWRPAEYQRSPPPSEVTVFVHLLSHGQAHSNLVSTAFPLQVGPPPFGAGLSQVLVLFTTEPPQMLSQMLHWPHSDQPPLTRKIVRKKRVSARWIAYDVGSERPLLVTGLWRSLFRDSDVTESTCLKGSWPKMV